MKFREKSKKKIFINITSLVDVLFLLLIFFIVSSTFLEQPGMKLDLPRTSAQEAVSTKGVTLTITAEGILFLNETQVTLDELKERLSEVAGTIGEEGLILKADESVRYGLVVEAMDIAKECGIGKLVVVTQPRDQVPERDRTPRQE